MLESQRAAYSRWYAKNKDRKRAEEKDIARLMRRLELDGAGVEAILGQIRAGTKYVEVAIDWLIETRDVSLIAMAHGIHRQPRRASPIPSQHSNTEAK